MNADIARSIAEIAENERKFASVERLMQHALEEIKRAAMSGKRKAFDPLRHCPFSSSADAVREVREQLVAKGYTIWPNAEHNAYLFDVSW